jgi:hypothetical protein
MRSAICIQIYRWDIARKNAEKELSGKSADGTAGGRGRKSNPNMIPREGLAEPKTRASHARSTVGQIAAAAQENAEK